MHWLDPNNQLMRHETWWEAWIEAVANDHHCRIDGLGKLGIAGEFDTSLERVEQQKAQLTYVTVPSTAFDNVVPGNNKEFLGKEIQDIEYLLLELIQREWRRHVEVLYR